MSNRLLSLFISSKTQELAEERRQVQAALAEYHLDGWRWEIDAGARSEPVCSTYLREVEGCDIYIGLFWKGYGPYTIEEFEHARLHHKPCLIYEKTNDLDIYEETSKLDRRDPQLQAFLSRLHEVHAADGLTIFPFKTTEELTRQVQKDVQRLLAGTFRQSQQDQQRRQQPETFLVPYQHNRLFTGRDHLLQHLHEQFQQSPEAASTQSQAITGLGGIGKTQIAIEYAYRYQQDYHHILWANAATALDLTRDYVTIAIELKLPLAEETDQSEVVKAVKNWLRTHDNWLLLLDNADDLAMTNSFLPAGGKGHVLLTTREADSGSMAAHVEVNKMTETEGLLFLLRRASRLSPREASLSQVSERDLPIAESIVRELDGLPLALEQAGAYIEINQSTLQAYLKAYQQRQTAILQKPIQQYSRSVATTWSLNFEQVERDNPRAADLLRCLAFLAPDAIPEELLITGASEFGPNLQAFGSDDTLLDEAIGTLRHFSLVRRNPDQRLLVVHRLVQTVLKASMAEATQKQWAEQTVRAVNRVFPSGEIDPRSPYERYLPHALQCAIHIDSYKFLFPEAAHLLNQTAVYLYIHAQYSQAEPLYQQALAIRRQTLGLNHPDIAESLNNLAELYRTQGNYEQAEPLHQQALAIWKETLGPDHPDTALCLNNLAELYRMQGNYEQAEALYQQALAIWKGLPGPTHPNIPTCLNNLGLLYYAQGKYEQAEACYHQALAIYQNMPGLDHPHTVSCLNNLALVYFKQDHYEQAKTLFQQTLAAHQKVFGSNHPNTALSFNNLGVVYSRLDDYKQAESHHRQALAIRQKTLGPNHPDTVQSLLKLMELYSRQGDSEQAEYFHQQIQAIQRKMPDADH